MENVTYSSKSFVFQMASKIQTVRIWLLKMSENQTCMTFSDFRLILFSYIRYLDPHIKNPCLVTKHERICLFASRILQKRTRILRHSRIKKHIVFYENVCKRKYAVVAYHIPFMHLYPFFRVSIKYAVVFVLANTSKYVWYVVIVLMRKYAHTCL